ncbi:MAG: carboxypeptidase-like regulatory domain-containing protein [Acidobacteriota bacterium]
MKGKGWIGGRYYVSRMNNVVGATVKLTFEGGRILFITATDSEGRWSFAKIPEGIYGVDLLKEMYLPIGKTNVNVRSPFKTVIELKATPSSGAIGSIRHWSASNMREDKVPSEKVAKHGEGPVFRIEGRVVSKDGNPLPDAEFLLRDFNGERNPIRLYSDNAGYVKVENVQARLLDATVSAIGHLPLRFPLDLDGDLKIQAVMVSQPQNYRYSPSELIPSERPLPPGE